ncbi:hypothetical protein FA15DRAFT_676444 [Coprinopsis marcescibilis]|uniref:Uncharacterized protein n=1 Tax=Coprinopsis marcescibilis TaxID=230819 RepID=A0A5C3KB18_COPMA|nr:hypothetical protein FA15DRAFT_676444 [Coprinopsis marcescibilis]
MAPPVVSAAFLDTKPTSVMHTSMLSDNTTRGPNHRPTHPPPPPAAPLPPRPQ